MDRSEVLALLPIVGTERMEIPAARDYKDENPVPKPCMVVYANIVHLWYMVEFLDGIRECYKAPKLKHYSECKGKKGPREHVIKKKGWKKKK